MEKDIVGSTLKCKVLMLPHNQQAKGCSVFITKKKELVYAQPNQPPMYGITTLGWQPQHLYFTTDREIQAGDWFYKSTSGKIDKALESQREYVQHATKNGAQRIEATTTRKIDMSIE